MTLISISSIIRLNRFAVTNITITDEGMGRTINNVCFRMVLISSLTGVPINLPKPLDEFIKEITGIHHHHETGYT